MSLLNNPNNQQGLIVIPVLKMKKQNLEELRSGHTARKKHSIHPKSDFLTMLKGQGREKVPEPRENSCSKGISE